MYRKREEFTFPAGAQRPIAQLSATHGRAGVILTMTGEVDAANASEFADCVHGLTMSGEWLVLDCSSMGFMGTAGVSALSRINTRCATADVRWALVPSSAVARLLRACPSTPRLPTVRSRAAALLAVQRECRRSA